MELMDYTAEIIVPLRIVGGKFVDGVEEIEVSLDCSTCQRNDRTVVFSNSKRKVFCTPTKHDFKGKLLNLQLREHEKGHYLVYRIQYAYTKFFDEKRNEPSVPHPTWARVRYTITCSNCGETNIISTQNNLSRPFSQLCSCGNVLVIEDEEVPFFRLFDLKDHLLYEQRQSYIAIYIYSQEVVAKVKNIFTEITGLTTKTLSKRIADGKPVYYQGKFHIDEPVIFSQNLEKMIFSLIETNTQFDAFDNGRSIKESFIDRYRRKA